MVHFLLDNCLLVLTLHNTITFGPKFYSRAPVSTDSVSEVYCAMGGGKQPKCAQYLFHLPLSLYTHYIRIPYFHTYETGRESML
jgi:hypothetical protein